MSGMANPARMRCQMSVYCGVMSLVSSCRAVCSVGVADVAALDAVTGVGVEARRVGVVMDASAV
ncbi:hypothetical protein GALL_514920 [mine drainage metagenome]|uniref:Uncharacterized protein n=1 Tax=mine drainage metagenome TaxID=410659 RepID=A0A1J5P868_9ZZZZ